MAQAEERREPRGAATGLPTARERDELQRLLREYNARPAERARLAEEIERRFRRPLAILVLDSSGFSRAVRAGGIVPFLALLERLGQLVRPLIARHSGRVLHTEADNIFAAFAGPADAVACAAAILRDLAAANAGLPDQEQIYVAIGVGFGPVLVVDRDTLYGDEMNLACKLGEDLAERGEVLLTASARDALAGSPWRFEPQQYSISGLDLLAYRLLPW
jgi:adenylate cyclase